MVTICIFDDDATSVERLRLLVEQCAPHESAHRTIATKSIGELLALQRDQHIDILICDIVTPQGQLSGIEAVERYFPPESGTQVIFVSGALDQALEVYRTTHLHFLLKPIDPAKLSDALARALEALSHRAPRMLRITCGHKNRLINVSRIRYLESNARVVTVHCVPDAYQTYAKLGDLHAQLPKTFSRCHRSFVVNLAFVSLLEEDEIRLHDGTTLPVSRRRAKQVQHDLLSYLALRG